jgi:hypothetical protein
MRLWRMPDFRNGARLTSAALTRQSSARNKAKARVSLMVHLPSCRPVAASGEPERVYLTVRPPSLHSARGREHPVSLDTSAKAATAPTAVLLGWLPIDLSDVAPRSARV